MLKMKPTCENCNCQLPPDSNNAMICTFECTFCADCTKDVLENVCPNCGGGFCQRPTRPATNWGKGYFLGNYPASTEIYHRPVDMQLMADLRARIGDLPPHLR